MTETMADTNWYAIQTYSGHENKVQKLIQRRIEEEPGIEEEGEILDVLVPTQEVVEIRSGKRVTVTRRLYPGYVLVQMALNERTVHVINNIQGVIKFVGSGRSPQPLREDEINKILGVEVNLFIDRVSRGTRRRHCLGDECERARNAARQGAWRKRHAKQRSRKA